MAYEGKNRGGGGFKAMAGLVAGPGYGAPRTRENIRKCANEFLKKIAKLKYYRLFCKRKFQTPALNFREVRGKTQLVGEIVRKL